MRRSYQLKNSDGTTVLVNSSGEPLITFASEKPSTLHITYHNANIDKEHLLMAAVEAFGEIHEAFIECGTNSELRLCRERLVELAANGFTSDSRKSFGMDWADLERQSIQSNRGYYYHADVPAEEFLSAAVSLHEALLREHSGECRYIVCFDSGGLSLEAVEKGLDIFGVSDCVQWLANDDEKRALIDIWVFPIDEKDKAQVWEGISHSEEGAKIDRPKKSSARMSAETLISRNVVLMWEFSIETPEDLKKALGDRYHNQEIRKALMDRLSEKDRILLRDFYYHDCPAGLDRRPACIKVTIDWAHSKMWIPKDRDYIQTIKAEFDRIKLRVTFKCQTQQGTQITIKASLDEAFAEKFFSLADSAWWEEPEMHSGINAFDADRFSVKCVFGEGSIRQSSGNHPDYHPYGELYELARHLFSHLCEALQ